MGSTEASTAVTDMVIPAFGRSAFRINPSSFELSLSIFPTPTYLYINFLAYMLLCEGCSGFGLFEGSNIATIAQDAQGPNSKEVHASHL